MARQVRTRPQNLQEQLMPCAQFEALEAPRQARPDWGVNSDESTVNDNDVNDDAEDAGDPQGEPDLVKKRIRKDTVNLTCLRESFSSAKEQRIDHHHGCTPTLH
jgi:hypothetical protein